MCTGGMSFTLLPLVIGGLVLGGALAGVLALSLSRGAAAPHPGVGAAQLDHLGPWPAQERTRLLAAALLGAIGAAAAIVTAVRFAWWPGLFLAGGIGALATLLAALLLRVPEPPSAPAHPSSPGGRPVDPRQVVKVAVVAAVAVAIAGAAAWFAEPRPEGGWGLPHEQVVSITHEVGSPPVITHQPGFVSPWLGWPDALLALLLAVAVALLLGIALRRLASGSLTDDEATDRHLRTQRTQALAGVVTGGMLAQVGMLAFGLGVQLAFLTDVAPVPTENGWFPAVAVQPHATIGAVAAVFGVVVLVLAVVQLVLAGLALTRLDAPVDVGMKD